MNSVSNAFQTSTTSDESNSRLLSFNGLRAWTPLRHHNSRNLPELVQLLPSSHPPKSHRCERSVGCTIRIKGSDNCTLNTKTQVADFGVCDYVKKPSHAETQRQFPFWLKPKITARPVPEAVAAAYRAIKSRKSVPLWYKLIEILGSLGGLSLESSVCQALCPPFDNGDFSSG